MQQIKSCAIIIMSMNYEIQKNTTTIRSDTNKTI